MNRSILLALAAALVAPAAMAHTPAQPILTCQDPAEGYYHEYIPVSQGNLVWGNDGNVENCGWNDWTFGTYPFDWVINPGGNTCATLGKPPVVCKPQPTGQDQPVLDYDGEMDHSGGGAWLFVTTGDGASAGAAACFGSRSVGHHGPRIFALDDAGFGPAFLLTSDFSRAGEEKTPDCGDSLVEPCDPTPPEPSTAPEPLNAVFDTYTATMYSIFGPSGDGCNVLDNALFVDAALVGPSQVDSPFGPGVSGAYVLFLQPDLDRGLVPQTGHIWTA